MIHETNRLQVFGDRVSFDGRFIQVVSREFQNKITKVKGVWECVERKTHGRIVSVFPITAEGNLILIKIFRIPLKGWVIEPVAGLMDGGPENEIVLARKEMREEIGYASDDIRLLCSGPFNAGLSTDEIATYVAFDAKQVASPALEDAEDIEIITVRLGNALDFLRLAQKEVYVDMKLFGAIALIKETYRGFL